MSVTVSPDPAAGPSVWRMTLALVGVAFGAPKPPRTRRAAR